MNAKYTRFAKTLQDLFQDTAEKISKKTNFIQRNRKLTAFMWLYVLVMQWLIYKHLSIGEMITEFAANDVNITPQAICKRFGEEKTTVFMEQIFLEAMTRLLEEGSPALLPVSSKFKGIYIGDCSTISLPADAADLFPGCGSNIGDKGKAAIKIYCRLEALCGKIEPLLIASGKTADQKIIQQSSGALPGSLHLHDMGFYNVERFNQYTQNKVYFISRIPSKKIVFYQDEKYTIGQFVRKFGENQDCIETNVLLGEQRIPMRLIAIRSPEQAVNGRLRRMNNKHKKQQSFRGYSGVSDEQKECAKWTIFVTNIPDDMCTADEIYTLYRVRWQIELLFKLWKSEGGLGFSHGKKGRRCLCEFYAKLIGILIVHWFLLQRGEPLSGYSSTRLFRHVQRQSVFLSRALASGDLDQIAKTVNQLAKELEAIIGQKPRKGKPSMRDTLKKPVTQPNTV